MDVDADTYTTTGIYPVRSGTNLPGTWLVLVVIATRDDTVIQYAYDNTRKYYRQFRGSWGTWEVQPSRAEVDALNSKPFFRPGTNATILDFLDSAGNQYHLTFNTNGIIMYDANWTVLWSYAP